MIALVLTIIVLAILASIGVSMISGDNSVVDKAGEVKSNSTLEQEKDILVQAISMARDGNKYGDLKRR